MGYSYHDACYLGNTMSWMQNSGFKAIYDGTFHLNKLGINRSFQRQMDCLLGETVAKSTWHELFLATTLAIVGTQCPGCRTMDSKRFMVALYI